MLSRKVQTRKGLRKKPHGFGQVNNNNNLKGITRLYFTTSKDGQIIPQFSVNFDTNLFEFYTVEALEAWKKGGMRHG